MILIRAVLVAVSVAATPAATQAQENPDHLVTLNTRTFDLGTDVSKMRLDPDFVPMDEIDWLRPVLDSDPVLGPTTVFHLKMAHPSTITASDAWEWGDPADGGSLAYRFKYASAIEERFQIPGFETRSYHEDGSGGVAMVPIDQNTDFAVLCSLDRESDKVLFCALRASYPPDPLIYLQARLYLPEPWMERREKLGVVADRMREIAYCLDVTDREIELDAEGQRRIAGCKVGAGM
jgi:hypothetical protein